MFILFPLLFVLIWLVVVFGGLGVWIWGLIDSLSVPSDAFYRTGTKLMWGLLIGLMGPLAAIVYFAVGRPDPATRSWIAGQKRAGVDLRFYGQPAPYVPPYGPGPAPYPHAQNTPGLPAASGAWTPEEQWHDDRAWLVEQEGSDPSFGQQETGPGEQTSPWQ